MELARTTTPDGMRLDGSFLASPAGVSRSVDEDALLLLHGVGGNFYNGALFDALVPALQSAGLALLRVNTRGHDAVSLAATGGGARRQGAAFETVGECLHDIAGWTSWLVERGYGRVGILGHSLGAIKALYAAAHQLPAEVRTIIAASPPRLSYRAFQEGPRSGDFFESFRAAKEFVDRGDPERLFMARFPFPLLISAESYLEKYGPEERYNFLRFVGQIEVKTLFTYGDIELEEGGVAFAGLPEAIRRAALPHLHVETISGADHFYTGVADRLSRCVLEWLQKS